MKPATVNMKKMGKKDRYNPVIDGMRIIAILAVILIHTSTRVLEAGQFNIDVYSLTFFTNQATRFAVPLFFMISGFVLELNYPYHQSYLVYVQKRFSKLFFPYLFWSFIYYYFIYTKHTISFLITLIYGTASYQLYFIPTLFIFYIVFPILNRNYKFIANKWTLIILGVIQIFLLYQDYYIKPLNLFYPLSIALLNFYIFILGMVASHHINLLKKIHKFKILLTGLVGLFAGIVFFEGKNLYLQTHNYLYFYTQWRPSVLTYTIVLASFLYIFFNRQTNTGIIKNFSKYSFFVFFIHVIILEFLWLFVGKQLFSNTQEFLFNFLFFAAVTIISYFIAYFTHKIPYLAKLTG